MHSVRKKKEDNVCPVMFAGSVSIEQGPIDAKYYLQIYMTRRVLHVVIFWSVYL